MRQLALPIQSLIVPTLENFVCGRNTEALARLRGLPLSGENEILVYLWGPKGSGKTHLLKALAGALAAQGKMPVYLDAGSAPDLKEPYADWILVDDIEKGTASFTESLFYRWNRIRESGGALIVTGESAPAQLPVAPELSSRLGWGQVFRLEVLTDEEKKEALKTQANDRHIPLQDEALDYLLTHVPRDMPTLMHVLYTLDEWSLSNKRAITIPLIREWLQSHDEAHR